MTLHFDPKKSSKSQECSSWQGFVCLATGREVIFHNALCVKLRKAKERIRSLVAEYDVIAGGKMQIDFLRDHDLKDDFRPQHFETTFDESMVNKVKWRKTIRHYFSECVLTDLRGYDLDEGDRFAAIPQSIKYLDQREFAVSLFRFVMEAVAVKEFYAFWQFVMFFGSYIPTPKLILLLKEYSKTLFHLHDDSRGNEEATFSRTGSQHLVDFLTVICEGAIYPMATCLLISAYLSEEGGKYWKQEVF